MIYLSDDIVVEILLRLPVKSLLRFRCVCKNWCFLIKTPHFIDRRLTFRRARGEEHLLVKRRVEPYQSFPDANNHVLNCHGGFDSLSIPSIVPDFDFDIEWYTGTYPFFSGYVNGIVCISDYGTVSLLNPTLREFRTLPAGPFVCPRDSFVSTEAIGFGFDDTTNDYKVVRYIESENLTSSGHCRTEIEVYSLRTNSWKGRATMPELYIDSSCSPIFFNGCVHWLANWIDDVDNDVILGFNMSTELFQDMQLPHNFKYHESDKLKSLFVVDKSTIALVAFTETLGWDRRGDFVNVWLMKEYGVQDSWVKQYSITPSLTIEKPLSFWKKDKLVLVTRDGELVYCDLPTGELHLLWTYVPIEGEDSVACSLETVICSESLFSIKQVVEQNSQRGNGSLEEKLKCNSGQVLFCSFQSSSWVTSKSSNYRPFLFRFFPVSYCLSYSLLRG